MDGEGCLLIYADTDLKIINEKWNFDAALYAMSPEMQEKMMPELVITYGGHIVSKRMKKFLRQHPPKELCCNSQSRC